jgi:hypothetical protein
MNQFGSAQKGRGKACKEMRLVFMLMGEGMLPFVVVLPPTSIPTLKKYLTRLSNKGVKYTRVITSLGLTEAQNKDGIKFAQATFAVAKGKDDKAIVLDAASFAHVEEYSKSLQTAFEQAQAEFTVTSDDYKADAAAAE